MAKPEHEFFDVSPIGFTRCEGNVEGLTERVIVTDDAAPEGVVTRMLKFAPICDTTPDGVQTHDFWEEVYILEGSITDLRLNEEFTAGMYACRPPGMEHGPWRSDEGCLTFEVRYPA